VDIFLVIFCVTLIYFYMSNMVGLGMGVFDHKQSV